MYHCQWIGKKNRIKNIGREQNKSVRSGIRTHAHRSGLRPERSALDHSAILTCRIMAGWIMILIFLETSICFGDYVNSNKKNLPRRGIEPRPPRWERGILTTRLPGNLNIGNGNNIWSMVLQYNRWMWVFDVLTWLIIEIVDEQINVYCSRIFIYIFATVPEASVA